MNIADVTYVLDAFRGFAYPAAQTPPAPGWPGPDACPPLAECQADIRVDSNNDGEIDYFDDFFEDFQGVTVVFNADDDNENGIPDWEEDDWESGTLIVEGEDDLVDLQLSSVWCAPGNWAGWSLSWDTAAPLRMWWEPDKSSGNEPPRNMNEYLANPEEATYAFDLLPRSVWLEATDAVGQDFEITFTIHAVSARNCMSMTGGSDKSDKVRATCPACTWRGPHLRYHIAARKYAENVTSASALIPTFWPLKLCGEDESWWHCTLAGISGVSVSVVRDVGGIKIWAQMGYMKIKAPLRPLQQGIYAELVYGDPPVDNREIYFDPSNEPPPSGTHRYTVQHFSSLFGKWDFYHYDLPFHSFTHDNWRGVAGTYAEWATELLQMEDQMVGTPAEHCVISGMTMAENWGTSHLANLLASDISFRPSSPGASQWGFAYINSYSFEVWDKFP